jgi:hypothetical protein
MIIHTKKNNNAAVIYARRVLFEKEYLTNNTFSQELLIWFLATTIH